MISKGEKIRAYVFVTAMLTLSMLPVLWMVLTSIKTPVQAFQIPPVWFFKPTAESYIEVFRKQNFWLYFTNSMVVTVVSTLISMVVGTLAAYPLARYRMKGKRSISFFVFFARMFPPVVLVLPFFIMFKRFNATDTIGSLIISYTAFNLPFVIWMMWSFLEGLPSSLEEAASIDGCSRFGAMMKVILPLTKPGLAVSAIFTAMNSWNEFIIALNITGAKAPTLPLMAASFVTQDAILWGPVTAAGTLIMLPLFVFTLMVQKHLVAGMTMGAVK